MQLITPFPRSVALAGPRSAALVGACRVESTIEQSASPRSSPEASLSVQTCILSRNRRFSLLCHHLCEELCEVGGRKVRTEHEQYLLLYSLLMMHCHCFYTTNTTGFILFLVETQRTYTTTTAQPVSEQRYGVTLGPRPPTPAIWGRHIMLVGSGSDSTNAPAARLLSIIAHRHPSASVPSAARARAFGNC
jgi:hypothetical protein